MRLRKLQKSRKKHYYPHTFNDSLAQDQVLFASKLIKLKKDPAHTYTFSDMNHTTQNFPNRVTFKRKS